MGDDNSSAEAIQMERMDVRLAPKTKRDSLLCIKKELEFLKDTIRGD